MSLSAPLKSVHEQDLKEIAEVILAVQRTQIVDFGVAAVGAGNKGVSVHLDLQQPGEPGAGHGQLFDTAAVMVAFFTHEFLR